ncbi:MAG: SRPBCC domain-containing protein [Desulfuromonadales bacterium]|nr:SRPBCC domain-containing protein [Desulfuromonadales bacterium]
MIKPIPKGYQSITPMCVFKDARQAINFYKAAFGAEERFVMPGPDGVGVMHAEIKIGTSLVMLGEECPQGKSAESLGGSPISFYLYLDDVDAAVAKAIAAGAVASMPVAEMFWGDRIGSVKDPFGYTWTLATHVKDPTMEEIEEGARAAMAATQPLTITRTFAAPRERVWKAWTEPEGLKRWWGPQGFTAPVCKIDLRVGGKYLNCMRSPEGQDFWSTGTYRELVAPERLVCTDSFADAEGNVVPASHYSMSGDWPLELQVSVTLEDEAGATRMTLHHLGLPPGEMKEMCAAGWNESFDKLTTFLQQEGT